MRLLPRWSLPMLFMLPAVVAAQSAPPPGRLRGQVTDSLGVAIPHASVDLLGTELTTTTNGDGLFRFQRLAPGHYSVLVRAIAWRPLFFDLTINSGEEWIGRVGLEPSPVQLPELSVTSRYAKPLRYANTTRFDGFYLRRRMGLGHYATREQVDAAIESGAISIGEIMQRMVIPGFRLSDAMKFERCRQGQGHIGMWVDGSPAIWANELDVRDIEAIEVYRGLAEIPAEFSDGACAAIVIWTKYN